VNTRNNIKNKVKDLYSKYPGELIGGVIGVIIASLILLIGFWKLLLILLLGVLCAGIGRLIMRQIQSKG
jgi:uncharacterized membrane protein